jgi:hypothetical protein
MMKTLPFCMMTGRGGHGGGVRTEDEVDLVDVEQLRVDAGHRRGVRLVVVIDELDRTTEKTALGVDLLLPDFHAQQRLPAVGGKRASERHGEADRNRLPGGRLGQGRH